MLEMPKETKKGKKVTGTNSTRNKMSSGTRKGGNLATTCTTDSSETETHKEVTLAECEQLGKKIVINWIGNNKQYKLPSGLYDQY